jgi:hypothetical protein
MRAASGRNFLTQLPITALSGRIRLAEAGLFLYFYAAFGLPRKLRS